MLIYNTGRYHGKQRKSTTVITSDISKGNTKLLLHARIYSPKDTLLPIKVEPPAVSIMPDQFDKEFEVTVSNITDVALTPKLIAVPHGTFAIEYSEKPIKPGAAMKMVFTVSEAPEAKTVKRSFTFELNDAKRTRFTIPIEITRKKK